MFERAFDKLIQIEGIDSDHPDDSGGRTRYGITDEVAQAHGYDVRSLTLEQAKRIYRADYWDHMMLDRVAEISKQLAYELFDTGVNQGTALAARYLQRALNVLNQKGKLYRDLRVDGQLGTKTLAALSAYQVVRGSEGLFVLRKMVVCQKGAFYIDLSEQREQDESFVYGWFAKRINLSA